MKLLLKRIRTIHQTSIVPCNFSLFSGKRPITFGIITAKPLDDIFLNDSEKKIILNHHSFDNKYVQFYQCLFNYCCDFNYLDIQHTNI